MGDFNNHSTRPFTFTFWAPEIFWGFTIDMTITFRTVDISPFIFTNDETFIDFTFVKVSIIILVTISKDEF